MIIFWMFLFVIWKFLIDNHELSWLWLILLFIWTIPWIIIWTTKLFSKLRKFQKKHNIANETIGFRCITSCSIIWIILEFYRFYSREDIWLILWSTLSLIWLILWIIILFHKTEKEYRIQNITIWIIFIAIWLILLHFMLHARWFPMNLIVVPFIFIPIWLAHLTKGLIKPHIQNEKNNKIATIGIRYSIFWLILVAIWLSSYNYISLWIWIILSITWFILWIIWLFYKPRKKARIAIGLFIFTTISFIIYLVELI